MFFGIQEQQKQQYQQQQLNKVTEDKEINSSDLLSTTTKDSVDSDGSNFYNIASTNISIWIDTNIFFPLVNLLMFAWEPNLGHSYIVKYNSLSKQHIKSIKSEVNFCYDSTKNMNNTILCTMTLTKDLTKRCNE